MAQQNEQHLYQRALEDFYEARRKAAIETLLARLRGESAELLSYDDVRARLRALETPKRILEEIPLEKIVGSVNRYTDFSRSFLPLQESDKQRWAHVRARVDMLEGLPPIEAYRVGDAYFVLDGHHRVSVARDIGAKTIQGYVTPVVTRVPLSPGDSPDDLILKEEYTNFLARTRIDEYQPDANLMLSAPGQYPRLAEHIDVHRYFMGLERGREISEREAVKDWYDTIYLPIVQMIRERNLLRDFPHRTETDLYLWVMEHRSKIGSGGIGWEVTAEKAISDLTERYSAAPGRRGRRVLRRLLDPITPDALTSGPPAGVWRTGRDSAWHERLFDDILVTLTGGQKGWSAQGIAVEIAQREGARLTGLHVASSQTELESEEHHAMERDFLLRCEEAGVRGRMVVEEGNAADAICKRSPWIDLAVFRLAYPPPQKIIKRLRSGVRRLIRQCSSPLLAAPDGAYHLNSAMIAYGPGRTAEEALYVAAYLAGRWKIPLYVITVQVEGTTPTSPTLLQHAREYLEARGINAIYIEERPMDPATAVLVNAEIHNAGLILTGSYEASAWKETLRGSTVDRILRSTRRPVLICR